MTIRMQHFACGLALFISTLIAAAFVVGPVPSHAQTAATSTVQFTVLKQLMGPSTFTADDFSFAISGNGIDEEVASGESIELPLGTYTLTELAPSGFDQDMWTILWSGPDVSCADDDDDDTTATFTIDNPNKDPVDCRAQNQYRPGRLTVLKEIVGTTTSATNFSFQVDGGPEIAFEESGINEGMKIVDVGAGAYTVTEVDAPGFTTTYSSGCTGTITNDGSAECTITNTWDDNGSTPTTTPGTLTIVKTVVNDDDGTSSPDDFSFTVNGGAATAFAAGTATTSTTTLSLAAGTYTIVEANAPGYAASYNNCTDVSLTAGGNATCTITNDDEDDDNGGGNGGDDDDDDNDGGGNDNDDDDDNDSNGGGGGGGERISLSASSSGDDDDDEPEGRVAGEQTSVIPAGAARGGAGGASGNADPLFLLAFGLAGIVIARTLFFVARQHA